MGAIEVSESQYDLSDLGGTIVSEQENVWNKRWPFEQEYAYKQAGERWDLSVRTGIPLKDISEVENVVRNAEFWAREPTFYEHYIEPYIPESVSDFVKRTILAPPREETIRALKVPMYWGAKFISGRTIGIPELIAGKPIEEFTGLPGQITPKERTIGEFFEFAGGLKTIGKAVSAGLSKLPIRQSLKTIATTGLTFGLRRADEELIDKLTKGDPIDWEGIHFEMGIGTLFGFGEAGIIKLHNFIKGYMAGTSIELAKLPEGSRGAMRANMRKEVNDALEKYRSTGDRTDWDIVRDKYMGLKKGKLAEVKPKEKQPKTKKPKPSAEASEEIKPVEEKQTISEWQDIKDLDAQIRTIKKPKKKGDMWEINIGLQESLGEKGGDITTEFFDNKPTLTEIRQRILNNYKDTKAEINKPLVAGIVAKSGRDELREPAIDNVLSKQGETWADEALGKLEKPVEQVTFTSVPKEWKSSKTLYDWGQKGLRTEGNQAYPASVGSKATRKTFIWSNEFEKLPVRTPEVLAAARAKTDEIWKVQARGANEDYYLVPKKVMAEIKASLKPESFVQKPKPIRSPKQQLNDLANKIARRKDLSLNEIGNAIEQVLKNSGLTEADLNSKLTEYLKEYRDAKKTGDIREAVSERMAQEVSVSKEELDERRAIQEEQLAGEIGDFLDGLDEGAKREKDLLGRTLLKGGASGKQLQLPLEIYVDKVPPTDVPTKVKLQNAVAIALNNDAQRVLQSKKKYKGYKDEKQLYEKEFADKPELFINPDNPLPEMRAAWTIATKGKGLFGGEMLPPPGSREAGFAYIPPLTVNSKLLEEHLNIKIERKKEDLSIIQRNLSLSQQAWNTKNPDIIAAAEELIDRGLVINNEIAATLKEDNHFFRLLPKEFREEKGELFFDFMDQTISPEEIDKSQVIPDDVKPILKHFKEREESMRQTIVNYKKEKLSAYYQTRLLDELQGRCDAVGIETVKQGKTKMINRTKAELADDLSNLETEKWGRQWGHIQHIFFGQYNLTFTDLEGKVHFIGKAETSQEAAEKLIEFKASRKAEGFDDTDKIKLKADVELHFPYDVTRLSRANYFRLLGELKEQADIESSRIYDVTRGIIGLKESKRKWWGALMPRTGKEGYSKDFWRVWESEISQFNKWKHLTEMNKIVSPLIDKIRVEGYPRWANWLEETKDYMWGRKRSLAGQTVDELLQQIPIVKDYVKPFALERWCGGLRTLNYWRHLQTPRFYMINSLQPFQTLYPVVGEKGIKRAIELYYSPEGQEILFSHKIISNAGKLHELGFRAGRDWQKYTFAGASEKRNQALAFLGLYDYAVNTLKLPEERAARYARLRGQLMTQFAYSPADIPAMMRTPAGAVMLQYKRFPIKSVELLSRLIREGQWGGVGRWLSVYTILGGIRVLTMPLSGLGLGYLGYKIYNAIKDNAGEDVADVAYYGLPSLLGTDIGTSIDIIPSLYGETIAEKIGNQLTGPTIQTSLRILENIMSTENTEDYSIPEKILRTLGETSPAANQFTYLIKALKKDTSVMDSQGRLKYREDIWDLWKKSFSFTPLEEAKQREAMNSIVDVKEEYDKICDQVALAFIDGNSEKAVRLIKQWTAMFPESPIDGESIESRIKNKLTNRVLTQEERMFLKSPKPVKIITGERVLNR